jgi:hypothetical protein
MTDPSFRDALLKQDEGTSVEAPLTVLDELLKADRRHIRRITFWTIFLWPVLVVIMALGLGVPLAPMALFCLPVAAVVLLVVALAARRSATMSQIQASLASIDAQLKLILSQQTSSTGPPG